MNDSNDMRELIPVSYDNPERPTVSGRELHDFLEVNTPYKQWFDRMTEYGFSENEDFVLVTQKCATNNPKNPVTERTDHQLTIPMAKELCMIQRNERGKQARQYFLAVEAKWNSPEAVMRRAVLIAQKQNDQLKAANRQLLAENNDLKPDAEYARAVCVGKNCRTTTSLFQGLRIERREAQQHPPRTEDPVQDQRRPVGAIHQVLRQGVHQKSQIHAVPAQKHRRVGHQEYHRLDGSGAAVYL